VHACKRLCLSCSAAHAAALQYVLGATEGQQCVNAQLHKMQVDAHLFKSMFDKVCLGMGRERACVYAAHVGMQRVLLCMCMSEYLRATNTARVEARH